MAILVSDLLKKLDAVPMSVIEDMGEELKTVQKSIKDENVLIGFNLAVTICNKYLGVVEVEEEQVPMSVIEDIRAEIEDYEEEVYHRPNTNYEAYASVRYCLDIFDKHCGKGN